MGAAHDRPFHKLAVIGAGNMGSGIAQKYATEGFDVVLVDVDESKVGAGLGRIRELLAEAVERRIFKADRAEGILGRIEGTADWNRLADVDLAVEAVFEDRAVKRRVFERLDRVCRPEALLATNTSSLRVSELARSTRHPERVLGLHYFYHPAKNRLVEVVPGEQTGEDARRRAWQLQEQAGKTPIASLDRPGFVVNRYFVPWANEAVRLLEQSVADIPTIEQAAKQAFGVGMGPFELMNVTGVPIALHASTTLGAELGPFYAPAERLRGQVQAGEPWPLAGEPDPARFQAVADRLLAVVFYVASALVDEGVGTVEDTDIGARVGLRWPRGPFELINRLGVDRAAELVERELQPHGLALPDLLESHARSCRPFTFEWVRSEVRDGIAHLTLNRPDALNALNEAVVGQLSEAFRRAEQDDAVRGIVIRSAGKAFVAGADIRFFVRNIESKDLERIVDFTRDGHELLRAIGECEKPVVARMHGLALGGGLELALACHAIVAGPKASMAFPETGIGIYPGLGGTQRTVRRVGRGLAKWMVYTGQMLSAHEAAAIGLIDQVVAHEALDRAVTEWVDRGARPVRPAKQLSDKHGQLERFFNDQPVARLLAGSADTGQDPALEQAAQRVSAKAPLALRLAERLIDQGARTELEDGLEMELDHLVEIFSTRDAYEGLSSLGKRKPAFEGR